MADFEDANSPTWDEHDRRPGQPRDAVRPHASTSTSDDGKRLRARRRRAADARRPAARLAPGRAPRRGRRRADVRPASSTSASTSSTTPARCSTRGSGPYFYLPKLESHLEARLWNDVFVFAQDALGIDRGHHPGDRADRDHPGRVRDGRDPLRAARPLRRPQRRPLGLHLQHHQEVPRHRPRLRAAGPQRRSP